MLVADKIICLGAKRIQDRFRKTGPQDQRRHPAGLPHQQKDKKVKDQKNNGKDVRTRQDCARITQVVPLLQRQTSRRFRRNGRATNETAGFARADQCPTVATNARAAGIVWWSVRQRNLECGEYSPPGPSWFVTTCLYRVCKRRRNAAFQTYFAISPNRFTRSSACSSSTARIPSSIRREVGSSFPR